MARTGIRSLVRNPAQFVLLSFVSLIAAGTALLVLPIAADGPGSVGIDNALFMSTSATTVTGLASLDIAAFSTFGELVILALIQIGGFGIMTIGSVVALLAFRRIGLRQRMLAQAEIGAIDMGDLTRLLWAIARITLAVEAAVALVLFVRFWQNDVEDGPLESLYSAVFHSIASFNNAGISLYSDNLARFVDDPLVTIPISIGFVVGGLGFPVVVEGWRRARAARRKRNEGRDHDRLPWSLHARLTVLATAVLLVIGPLMVLSFEWTNPDTLGPLDMVDKLATGWFHGTTPRTAGFNTVDVGAMNDPTLFTTSILMFIGAGSASTGGGIKVTTTALLVAILWTEIRGRRDVDMFRRRIPERAIRQAFTITTLSLAVVLVTSMVLMASDDLELTSALFESTSAFATVGLSTGVTTAIGEFGQVLLVIVMLCGRVGPLTFMTAIALRERDHLYRHPEEQPIIG